MSKAFPQTRGNLNVALVRSFNDDISRGMTELWMGDHQAVSILYLPFSEKAYRIFGRRVQSVHGDWRDDEGSFSGLCLFSRHDPDESPLQSSSDIDTVV